MRCAEVRIRMFAGRARVVVASEGTVDGFRRGRRRGGEADEAVDDSTSVARNDAT